MGLHGIISRATLADMNVLLVIAHPITDSLCAHLAADTANKLRMQGHDLRLRDLYQIEFAPALTAQERRGYYGPPAPVDPRNDLIWADAMVLVFPTWWFGLPAILKGWIDRSFLPGVAYDHAPDLSAMIPRLTRLKHVLVLTTLGSPWWVDRLILWQPVARVLKWAVIRPCAPQAKFRILSLYEAEKLTEQQVQKHKKRVEKVILGWSAE